MGINSKLFYSYILDQLQKIGVIKSHRCNPNIQKYGKATA
jgi:hypothetical protein